MNCHNGTGEAEFPDMPSSYYYDEKLNNTRISKITERMIRSFDVVVIRKKRRANFDLYMKFLSDEKDVEPLYRNLSDGVCPLYFPVIVKNRRQICRKLNGLSIGAVAFWAGYHRGLPWNDYPEACFLKDHLLALPVRHQLREGHIRYISQQLMTIAREYAA